MKPLPGPPRCAPREIRLGSAQIYPLTWRVVKGDEPGPALRPGNRPRLRPAPFVLMVRACGIDPLRLSKHPWKRKLRILLKTQG